MFDIIHFVKYLVMTFLIVLLMQIKIGENTFEQKAHAFIQTSSVTEPLRQVADGGERILRQSWRKLWGMFDKDLFKKMQREHLAGSRSLIDIERSEQFIKENAKKIRERAQIEGESFGQEYAENIAEELAAETE